MAKVNFPEYRNLLIQLHNYYINEQPEEQDLIAKIEDAEENLSPSDLHLGDLLSAYLSGYRDGKLDNRKIIEHTKEISEDSDDIEKLNLLQTHRHELYEQGFDDYSYDVEELDNEIDEIKGTIADVEIRSSDVYESYLTGFLHAKNGETCQSIT